MNFFSNGEDQKLRFWEIMAFAAYFIGLAAIGVFAASQTSLLIFGVLWIVGTASWLSGSAIGFLFGVPRVRNEEITDSVVPPDGGAGQGVSVLGDGDEEQATATSTKIVPNTNLEQISDWLTKIIVGATLVQLEPLARGIGELAIFIGSGLGTAGESSVGAAVSGGVLIFYFAAGFLWGYLWCSLRIFREMQQLVKNWREFQSRNLKPGTRTQQMVTKTE